MLGDTLSHPEPLGVPNNTQRQLPTCEVYLYLQGIQLKKYQIPACVHFMVLGPGGVKGISQRQIRQFFLLRSLRFSRTIKCFLS